jgi:hypothetical protein
VPIAALLSTIGAPVQPPSPPPPTPPPSPPPDPLNRIATYKIEVAWSHNVPGVAVLDLSTLGGTDLLGGSGSYFIQQFGGPYDDITNRSDNHVRVEQVTWTRGRSDDLAEQNALSCTITGRDPTGMMNIHNSNSPLNQGSLVNGDLRPLRPVRITGTFLGSSHPMILGLLRSFEYEPQGRTGTFQLEVTDLFVMLDTPRKDQPNAGVAPIIAYTTGITTGAAIGLVLDYIGWTDPNLRRLDAGDILPFFEAIGDKTALALIQELVQASLGLFYIAPDGAAVYVARNNRFARPVQAGFTNTMKAVGSGSSVDTIKNKWTVTRQIRQGPGQYTDGVPQVASDFASANTYGERGDTFSSPYILTDALALQIAQQLLATTKDPLNPVWRLDVENRDSYLLSSMFAVDLIDRVSVSEAETNTFGTFFVESIQGSIDITGHKHKVSYILSDRSAVAGATLNPFILGTDTLDGPKVLGF